MGPHTGHVNNVDKKRFNDEPRFCTKDINLKKFKENMSEITIFHLQNPGNILAPFQKL